MVASVSNMSTTTMSALVSESSGDAPPHACSDHVEEGVNVDDTPATVNTNTSSANVFMLLIVIIEQGGSVKRETCKETVAVDCCRDWCGPFLRRFQTMRKKTEKPVFLFGVWSSFSKLAGEL